MRRSLAPSQRNKTVGSNLLSKFKSPLLKSSGATRGTTISSIKTKKPNNITNLKTKILKEETKSNDEVADTKENQIRDDNVMRTETTMPSAKRIKLAGNKRPLFNKPTPQLSISKEKLQEKEEEEEDGKSTRKLYYNVVW